MATVRLNLLVTSFLLVTSVIHHSISQSGSCDIQSCVTSICPEGQFYFNNETTEGPPSSLNDCCTIADCDTVDANNDTLNVSGSGSRFGNENCWSCDPSCDQCFGPTPSQCYSCSNGPYIILIRSTISERNGDEIVCDDNYIRNTSLDVVQCLTVCPVGSVLNTLTLECTCSEGHYQNDSTCLECISFCSSCVNGTQAGCLTCSGVNHNGICMGTCPAGTHNVSGVCQELPEQPRFDFQVIIGVVAGVGGALMIAVILLIICTCCCIYKKRLDSKIYWEEGFEGNAVTTSESFKKVTRNISFKNTRTKKQASTHSTNSVYLEELRNSFDPYKEENVIQNTQASEDEKETPLLSRNAHNESVYVKMSPATSLDKLDEESNSRTNIGAPKKRVSIALSLQDQHHGRPRDPSPPSHSTLPAVGSYQEHYVDPSEFRIPHQEEEDDQYVYHEFSGGTGTRVDDDEDEVREMYENFGVHQKNEDEDEQCMYEDLSGNFTNAPVIPPRSVRAANSNKSKPVPPKKTPISPPPKIPPKPTIVVADERRETLDNQYVVMSRVQRKAIVSTSELGDRNYDHRYVNVSRDNQRLRSITSPRLDPPPRLDPSPRQEHYANVSFNYDDDSGVEEAVYV